jgi:hypothetical protein
LNDNRLEPEYAEVWDAWSKTKTPQTASALLKTLDPVLRSAAKQHVGSDDPLAVSRARRLALSAFPKYDPAKAGMRTFLSQQLMSLKRQARQANTILSVPERVSLGRSRLDNLRREMEHELGRLPSHGELADRAAVPVKTVKRWLAYSPPVAEGTIAAASVDGEAPELGTMASGGRAWRDLVYAELDPLKQAIVDLSEETHPNGAPRWSNEQIASKLRRSPSAITQQKAKIQRLLDRERDLSPF